MYIKTKFIEFINEEYSTIKERLSSDAVFRYYYKFGNLDDIDVPVITNQNVNWFFNQMLLIIDEFRLNNIKSDDYINDTNLGYKLNGNLGIFDIGFGDYYAEFETEPETIPLDKTLNTHQQILNYFHIKSVKEIGTGLMGTAFDIGDNRILKITKDKSEAVNCSKIVGKKLNHIANVYSVKQVLLNKSYYCIILEKLILDNNIIKLNNELKEYFDFYRCKHLNKSILDKISVKHKIVADFLKNMIKIGYEETWNKWIDKLKSKKLLEKYDFNDISEISDWIKGSVTNHHDVDSEPNDYIIKLVDELTK